MVTNDNRENFKRLAINRVKRAIKYVRLIGNLSNKSNYSYTQEDIKKIFAELEKEVELCKQRFELQKRSKDIDFELGD